MFWMTVLPTVTSRFDCSARCGRRGGVFSRVGGVESSGGFLVLAKAQKTHFYRINGAKEEGLPKERLHQPKLDKLNAFKKPCERTSHFTWSCQEVIGWAQKVSSKKEKLVWLKRKKNGSNICRTNGSFSFSFLHLSRKWGDQNLNA